MVLCTLFAVPAVPCFHLVVDLKNPVVLYIVLGALVFMAVGAFNYFNNMFMMAQQQAIYDDMTIELTDHTANLVTNMW